LLRVKSACFALKVNQVMTGKLRIPFSFSAQTCKRN
jgi:hypothetical protein